MRGPGLRSSPPLHHVDPKPEHVRPNSVVVGSFAVRVLLTVTHSLSALTGLYNP